MTKIQIFQPSSSLAKKVTLVDDETTKNAIKQAENFMETQKINYPAWLDDDLKNLKNTFKKINPNSNNQQKNLLNDIFKISLEIKGQGGTYGYPLISYVADNICTLLDSVSKISKEDIEIIRIHIDLLSIIAKNRIKDIPNNQKTKQILNGLDKIIKNRIKSLNLST